MATNEACPAQIWAYCILMTSAISIYGHKDMGTNGACPNMGHIWPQMRHAQIWAYCILMTSAISIYGHKRDKDMGTNGACPNMGILYTDDDISNLHIWAHKGQGLTAIQLS